MNDDKRIPEMTSYDMAAEFWDKNSLADFGGKQKQPSLTSHIILIVSIWRL